MQLTSQEEYGLRCLLQVARHRGPQPLRIHEVAASEGLGTEYVAKLMRILRRADLVTSTRGAAGGYRLARESDAISIWEVVVTLGDPLFNDAFCNSHSGKLNDCIHTTDCSIRALWGWVGGAVEGVLKKITLADMLSPERGMRDYLGVDELSLVAPTA